MTKEELIVKELTPFLLKNVKTVDDMIPLLGKSVGALWERALPIISGGKYKFIDENHHDMTDGTEAKTASVMPSPKKYKGKPGNHYPGSITNVADYKGHFKTGDLRVAVYNPHVERVDYFYIPVKDIPSLATKKPANEGTGINQYIRFGWNKLADSYTVIDKYQVSLQEVAA